MKQIKRLFFAIAIFLIPHGMHANDQILAKVCLKNDAGYFFLSNGTFWKIIPFKKRWRTLSEWWNGTEILSKDYQTRVKDWYLGAEVTIHPNQAMQDLIENTSSNVKELEKCTHILVNPNSRKVLFAILLTPGACMGDIYSNGRYEGDQEGYSRGWNIGFALGCAMKGDQERARRESYNRGRQVGYDEGYQDGYRNALDVD